MAEKKSSEPPPAPQAPQVNDFFPQVGNVLIGRNQHSRFINKKIKNKVLKKLKMREDKFFLFVETLERTYIGITRLKPNQEKLQELTYKILKNNPDDMNIHKFVTIIPEIITAHKTELTQPNLMNNRAIDGEDDLKTMLRQKSKQEQEKEEERHRQSPTNEDFEEGLVFGQPDMGGGKKKSKTRRKRKKRKTKKRRKNKRKTKKRRKTKRRKTKRRKK